MNLIRIFALLATCSMLPVPACGGPVEEDVATAASAELLAVPNAAPGSGTGGSIWCCFHAGGGIWHVGEIATDGTVVTAANYAGLCASGRLPVRQVCR